MTTLRYLLAGSVVLSLMGQTASAVSPWVSIGPNLSVTDRLWPGLLLRGGVSEMLSPSFSGGVFLGHSLNSEKITGTFAGRIYRSYLMPELTYMTDSQTFFGAGIGAALIGGSHVDFVAKVKETFLLEIGIPINTNWSWSVSYSYTGSAQTSISFFAENFGRDSVADGNTSGISPASHLMSLNFNYWL